MIKQYSFLSHHTLYPQLSWYPCFLKDPWGLLNLLTLLFIYWATFNNYRERGTRKKIMVLVHFFLRQVETHSLPGGNYVKNSLVPNLPILFPSSSLPAAITSTVRHYYYLLYHYNMISLYHIWLYFNDYNTTTIFWTLLVQKKKQPISSSTTHRNYGCHLAATFCTTT